MKILWFSVTEWIAIGGVIVGFIFGLMKFYNVLMNINVSIDRLNSTMNNLDDKYADHETRIARLEEQNKTLFRNIGGAK